MKVVGAVLVVSLGLVASPTRSDACIPLANQPFVLDPAHAGDTTPPTSIMTCDWFTTATLDDDPAGCGRGGDLWLFPDSTDDATPADQLGYFFHLQGTPEGEPVKLLPTDGALLMGFDIDRDVVELAVRVQPIDLAGNRGKAMICDVSWTNPNPESGGCASTHGAGLGIALVLLALRRRPTRA